MIRQDDKSLPKAINNWGCYFMSVIFLAGKKLGKVFDAIEIESIYRSAMMTGIIGNENYKDGVLIDGCYINDPVALFQLCGVAVGSVRRDTANYKATVNELEIQHWRRDANTPRGYTNAAHDHFVAAIDGKIAYDGLGASNTCRLGYLKSKRIFK